ncbi:MAG: permease-like cell division protein FtsX [Bacteroidota bacterium]
MIGTENKNISKNKINTNLFSIFIINTIILFTLSIIGFIYLKSSSIENYFKENITINIYLKNSTKEVEFNQLYKYLNLSDIVKKVESISKEDAALIFAEEIGEEFVGFLGYNPLLDMISINLYGEIIDVYNIEEFISSLNNFEFIEDVEYDKPLVEILSENFERIGYWIIIVGILFFITSFLLINNSIKISIFSKREIIKTMQLVGATGSFIRRPFIIEYVKISLYACLLALFLFIIVLFQITYQIQEFDVFDNTNDIVTLTIFLMFFGSISSFISSYFVTQKHLKLKVSR